MRKSATLFTALLLAACGGAEDGAPAADEGAEMVGAAAPVVADFAGSWESTAVLEGVADPVPVTIMSTMDATEWTMQLAGRDPVALTATMVGDSLILDSEAYESVLREGVMVTVRTAMVMADGGITGKMVATYQTPDGDEIVAGTVEGSRSGGM
jgi:hypothetical protein